MCQFCLKYKELWSIFDKCLHCYFSKGFTWIIVIFFPKALWNSYYYFHFTDGETKTLKSSKNIELVSIEEWIWVKVVWLWTLCSSLVLKTKIFLRSPRGIRERASKSRVLNFFRWNAYSVWIRQWQIPKCVFSNLLI